MREVEVKGEPTPDGGWKISYSDGLTDEESEALRQFFLANPDDGKGFRLTIRGGSWPRAYWPIPNL